MLARHDETVGVEAGEPFAGTVGAVEVQRLARAAHRFGQRPERDQVEELVDTVNGERRRDRFGATGRELRVDTVHRGLVRLPPRPETARLIGGQRVQLDAGPGGRERIGHERDPGREPFDALGRRGRIAAPPVLVPCGGTRVDEVRDAPVDTADVTEQIRDRPLRTRRHRRVDARPRGGRRERASLRADRGDVLVVVQARRRR